ncbi:MAG: hypothetical protein N2Z21_06550 [Candidatus Sumerlaeaceae bacterium]|nr:hypothetical protein [Candidatus Sumerlaeaceae bacterium]
MGIVVSGFKMAVLMLLAGALLGCGQQPEKRPRVHETSSAIPTQTGGQKDSARVARPHLAPSVSEQETSDAKEIVGSLILVEPNEIRLYFSPSFPTDKRASVRGTVCVDGGSTVPSPFYQTPTMEYLVALVPDIVKSPIGVTLNLQADGYRQAEFKMTLSTVVVGEKKSQAVVSASNPKEYSKLVELELSRLQTVIENGNLSLAPDFTRQLADAVSGLALTSREQVEMKLQHPIAILADVATSMTKAKESGDVQYAHKLLEEVKNIIVNEVAPNFVKD